MRKLFALLIFLITYNLVFGQQYDTTLTEARKKDIYAYTQYIIAAAHLDKNYSLLLTPSVRCCCESCEFDFLIGFLKDSIEPNDTSLLISVSYPEKIKVLTKADVEFMAKQYKGIENFKWDNSILQFKRKNKKSWYAISIPLVSKDKSKAVINVTTFCKGFLCGTGKTYLIYKNGKNWDVKIIRDWII